MRLRLILSFLALILINFSGVAQDRHPSSSDIEVLKAKFIADRLNLTPEEAQLFWPVYNNYQRELNALWEQKIRNRKNNTDPESALTTDFSLDGKILYTRRKYQKEFQRVIPAQKVLAFYRADPEFREYLMRRLSRGDDRTKN